MAVGLTGVLWGMWDLPPTRGWLPAAEMGPPTTLLFRFPGTFVGTAEPASPPLSSTSPTTTAATMPMGPSVADLAPPGEAALRLEEVAPPASGTRKARVLYDYEASDSSELALLADEVGLEATGTGWRSGSTGRLRGPGDQSWGYGVCGPRITGSPPLRVWGEGGEPGPATANRQLQL